MTQLVIGSCTVVNQTQTTAASAAGMEIINLGMKESETAVTGVAGLD